TATVTSPSIRSFSSKSVSRTVCPASVFSTTTALNVAIAPSRSCRQRRHPRYRLLYDRQIDQRGKYTEQDRQPPDRIVRTRALEHNAAEPPARAEHDDDNAVGRRHCGKPPRGNKRSQ